MQASTWKLQRYSERLRHARQRAGLSQAELAAKLSLRQFSISRIEGGRKPREPGLSAVVKYIENSEDLSDEVVSSISRALVDSSELRELIKRILSEKSA